MNELPDIPYQIILNHLDSQSMKNLALTNKENYNLFRINRKIYLEKLLYNLSYKNLIQIIRELNIENKFPIISSIEDNRNFIYQSLKLKRTNKLIIQIDLIIKLIIYQLGKLKKEFINYIIDNDIIYNFNVTNKIDFYVKLLEKYEMNIRYLEDFYGVSFEIRNKLFDFNKTFVINYIRNILIIGIEDIGFMNDRLEILNEYDKNKNN